MNVAVDIPHIKNLETVLLACCRLWYANNPIIYQTINCEEKNHFGFVHSINRVLKCIDEYCYRENQVCKCTPTGMKLTWTLRQWR